MRKYSRGGGGRTTERSERGFVTAGFKFIRIDTESKDKLSELKLF